MKPFFDQFPDVEHLLTGPTLCPSQHPRATLFGAGGHSLNMGDRLSYGAARMARARLLYVGDDFARTDVNDPL